MKFMFIYKTTNIINNHFYIGQHVTNNLNDGYLGSGTLLHYELNKFGISNFRREILQFCSNSEEMNLLEIEYIKQNISNKFNINICISHDNWNLVNEAIKTGLITHPLLNKISLRKFTNSRYQYRYIDKDSKDTINNLINNGWEIGGRRFEVYNDNKKIFHINEQNKHLIKDLKLNKGIIKGSYNFPMLGKVQSEETKLKISKVLNSLDKDGVRFQDKLNIKIKIALNTKGEDGLTVIQRAMRTPDKISNITPTEKSIRTQIKNNSNIFINKNTNPNYKILEDGKSVPYHNNIKRVNNGSHNLLSLTKELSSIGCHPSSCKKRFNIFRKFINGKIVQGVLKVDIILFNEYLLYNKNENRSFSYKGFVYQINKLVKGNIFNKVIIKYENN